MHSLIHLLIHSTDNRHVPLRYQALFSGWGIISDQ